MRSFTPHDALELAQARHLLETAGVQAADPRALDALCDRLDGLCEAQEAASRAHDREAFVDTSLLFHRAFVEVGGNGLLLACADRLQGRQGLVLRVSLGDPRPVPGEPDVPASAT